MKQDDVLNLLQPYVDGELDAATYLELERHLAGDPTARARLAQLRSLSATVRAAADYHVSPVSLRSSVLAQTIGAAPQRARSRSGGWLAQWVRMAGVGATAAAIASIVTVAVLRPTEESQVERDIFAAHVRATVGDRLIDVASADRHAVKPWLSARLGFSPPVPDLSGSGYELVGGRVDVVGAERVAVIVYRRRQHMIDVLVRPSAAEALPAKSTRDGFNLNHFAQHGFGFWLVSDLNANELGDLARLLAVSSGP